MSLVDIIAIAAGVWLVGSMPAAFLVGRYFTTSYSRESGVLLIIVWPVLPILVLWFWLQKLGDS